MSKPKTSVERLTKAREVVRREREYQRERSEHYAGPNHTIDTSSARFRRDNPFYDDGSGHESMEG
jgi:hypothetical protein